MIQSDNPKAHALVFPYPYLGHISPTLNLAVKLASGGFAVTFVLPEFLFHHYTKPRIGGGADVCFTAISDGFSNEFDRVRNFEEYWESMIADFPARADDFVTSVRRADETGTKFFLVADTLYTWPANVATKHGLVNVSFWTEPALVFNIGYHLDLLEQNGHCPYQGSSVDNINYLPGVDSLTTNDLMSQLRQPDVVPILSKITKMAFEKAKKADFILCNTIEELEPSCLNALNQRRPTYAVGPITSSTGESILRCQTSDCTAWLESRPLASVLYISQGSLFEFDAGEIEELAHALLSTRVNFLWVLKVDENKGSIFPRGFLDDVAGRGLVVPWCDQKAVLSSPTVGGFLTHCGWNSTLESMWSGVPMLCHPFGVDQPTNRRLVVEDWRIGIDLCDRGKVTREEASRKIDELMVGIRSEELKEEAKKVRGIVRSALGNDGSSKGNFVRFVRDLKSRLQEMKEEGPKN